MMYFEYARQEITNVCCYVFFNVKILKMQDILCNTNKHFMSRIGVYNCTTFIDKVVRHPVLPVLDSAQRVSACYMRPHVVENLGNRYFAEDSVTHHMLATSPSL